MQRGYKVLGCLMCALFTFGGAAVAQDAGSQPVKLSLWLRADYTDNRDSLDKPNDESTWDFYVKPRIDVFLDGERSFLDFFYAPAVRYRTDLRTDSAGNDIQNQTEVFHDLGLNTECDVTPGLAVRLVEKLDYTDDAEIEEGGTIVRRDESFWLNRTTVGANHQLTSDTDVDLSGRYTSKRYDEAVVAEDSDEDRADGILEVTKVMSPSLIGFCKGSYSDFSFDSSEGLQRDFTSILVAGGLEKALNNHLRTGLALGIQNQDYDDPGVDTKNVPYVNAWVQGRTIPSTRITASAEYGLRDADVYPYASQKYTDLRLGVQWDCTPRVMLAANGIYRRSDYEDGVPDSAAADDVTGVPGGTEDRYIAQVSATYKINSGTSLILMQRYENLESDVAEPFEKNTTKLVFGRDF